MAMAIVWQQVDVAVKTNDFSIYCIYFNSFFILSIISFPISFFRLYSEHITWELIGADYMQNPSIRKCW